LFSLKDNDFVQVWISFNELPVRFLNDVRNRSRWNALSQDRNGRGGQDDIADTSQSDQEDFFYLGRINPFIQDKPEFREAEDLSPSYLSFGLSYTIVLSPVK